MIKFVLKDDRFRLLERAIKDLERRNNYQISGSIAIRGTCFDLENGPGYVSLTDGSKACIVKMQHSFSGGFTTSLELTTEEMRVGEEKEFDKDYKRAMETKINQYTFGAGQGSGTVVKHGTDSKPVSMPGSNSPTHVD
jgi:hypothetical protein